MPAQFGVHSRLWVHAVSAEYLVGYESIAITGIHDPRCSDTPV